MKKNLLAIAAACFTTFTFAQTIPNNSFENWTTTGNYSDPDSWTTLNSSTDPASVYTVTQGTPGNPGNYYIKITSKTVLTTVVPGIATTGIINVQAQSVSGGYPFTSRPATLTGKWQYMAMSGTDQGSIDVITTKWNTMTNSRDTICSTQYMLPGMAMSWANFSIPLTYLSTATPDTCLIILASSNATPAANSYLYVDNLAFAGTVGIDENTVSVNNLSVFPNPANSNVTVSFNLQEQSNVKLQLVDVTGKLIREENPSAMKGDNLVSMNLDGIENGIYFIRLISDKGTDTKKIIVQ